MKKGFTLIELLVVVLIIGILAAIALPQYQKAVAKSRMTGMLTHLRYLRTEVDTFYLANGRYPTSKAELGINDSPEYRYVFGDNIYIGVSAKDSAYMFFYILDHGSWKSVTDKWGCSLIKSDDGTTSTGALLCKQFCNVSSLSVVWGSGEKGCRFKP